MLGDLGRWQLLQLLRIFDYELAVSGDRVHLEHLAELVAPLRAEKERDREHLQPTCSLAALLQCVVWLDRDADGCLYRPWL